MSVLGTIKGLIQTDLETVAGSSTPLTEVYQHWEDYSSPTLPYGVIFYGEPERTIHYGERGPLTSDSNGVIDLFFPVRVVIVAENDTAGDGAEDIDAALEAIQITWFDNTRWAAMKAADVVDVTPILHRPITTIDAGANLQGEILFEFVVRYTY